MDIPSLPVELVSFILEQVDGGSKSTLLNAALCSHQFYDIAIPLLYRRIDIGDREEDDTGKFDLKKLLLHFLRKPELARHVHHFSIRPAFDDGLESERDRDALPTNRLSRALDLAKDLEDEIKDAIAEASHSRREQVKWLEEIDLEDSILALLLPKFANLQTLDLEIASGANSVKCMLERVARKEKPFDKNPTFTHLHSITWVAVDESIGGRPAGVVFMLPSVQSIYLYRAGSEDDDDVNKEFSNIKHETSSCTELEMRDCRFNIGDIAAVLSIPKHLKTFIYEVGWGELSFCYVSFPALREALERHKDTLENLTLDYGYEGIEWLDDDIDTILPMASFKDFSKLRRLRIAPDFVFGEDIEKANDHPDQYLLDLLPRSLELLHIKHGNNFGYQIDPSDFDAGIKWEVFFLSLRIVLSNRDSALPSLRQIVLDTTMERIEESRSQFEELKDLAKDSNVEFILQNNFNDKEDEKYEERQERKWGFDENIEWKECSTAINTAPPFETIEL